MWKTCSFVSLKQCSGGRFDTKFFPLTQNRFLFLPQVEKWLFLVSLGILFCIISQRNKLLDKSHRYFVAKSSENRWDRFYGVQACGSVFFPPLLILQKIPLMVHSDVHMLYAIYRSPEIMYP